MPFFSRLWLAIVCFFRIVFNGGFANRVAEVSEGALPLTAKTPELPAQKSADGEQALHLLSLLQREGRLIDFVEEDLSGFSDAQIGAAARAVHDGCRKALRDALSLAPVRSEAEGARVTLPAGFDARAVRLTGNVVGNPPFNGVLRHHGWKAAAVRLPEMSGDATLLAPAEVELP
jgi:hypothetical protein